MQRQTQCAAILLLLFTLAGQTRGDNILVFKDGFIIRGKVKQPKDLELLPGGGAISIPLAGSHYYVDDHVRRILFSPRQVAPGGILKEDANKGLMRLKKIGTSRIGDSFLPGWEFDSISDWDKRWERKISVYVRERGHFDIIQRVTLLTPEYTRVDTLNIFWIPYYFTKELGPEPLRKLLQAHYASDKSAKNLKEGEKRLEIFRFLYQTGWLEHASQELEDLMKKNPDVKSQALEYKDKLEKLQAGQFVDNLAQAMKAAQYETVDKALRHYQNARLSRLVSAKQVLQVQEIKNKRQASGEKLKQVRAALKNMAGRLGTKGKGSFAEFVETILADLHVDVLPRLETFRVYALQHERELAEKKAKTSQSAEEVVALAISGWLQGDAIAEPDVKAAQALLRARKLLLDCQKTGDPAVRQRLINAFAKETKLGVDAFVRMIPFLPPTDPPESISTEMQKLTIGEGQARGMPYLLQLPPEYHPSRTYPVLMLLHTAGDRPEHLLGRFRELAARHGYILVAPTWGKGLRFSYQYSPDEHAVVTDCLRELRRNYQVDSDRVFLFGWRAGGTMAFDVGLSHPDLFAGVLTMNGNPTGFGHRYYANAQYLPCYCIDGDMNSNGPKAHRALFKDWIRGGYPSLYMEYKGRASEWFSAELPIMFDWMNRKTRAHPMKELGLPHLGGGRGEEFATLRSSDNSFYWLTTGAISERCQATYADLGRKNPPVNPATLYAKITLPENVLVKKDGVINNADIYNHINIRTRGVEQLTIWFGPKMIDFAKPVQLRVNGSVDRRRNVQPTLRVLIDDFCERGDRQRLFIAKIDLNLR